MPLCVTVSQNVDIEKIHKLPLTINHLCLYTRVMNNISRKRFIVGSGLSVVVGVMGMSRCAGLSGYLVITSRQPSFITVAISPMSQELKALGKTRKEIEEFQTWLRTVPVDVLKASDSHRAEQEEVLKRSNLISSAPTRDPWHMRFGKAIKTRRHGERNL